MTPKKTVAKKTVAKKTVAKKPPVKTKKAKTVEISITSIPPRLMRALEARAEALDISIRELCEAVIAQHIETE